MAKRGGYMGGMGGGMPGNMKNLMKQAQKMQREMEEAQANLSEQEFTATAGGNAVEVTVSCDKTVKGVKIAPEAVDPDDVEMLQDLIVAAVNSAMDQVDEAQKKVMGAASGGLGGLGGMPF